MALCCCESIAAELVGSEVDDVGDPCREADDEADDFLRVDGLPSEVEELGGAWASEGRATSPFCSP